MNEYGFRTKSLRVIGFRTNIPVVDLVKVQSWE